MPELPDITVYIEALERRIKGLALERVEFVNPFVLRTVDPPHTFTFGKTVTAIRRLGKRIVFELEGGFFIVVHLMIAGRFHWHDQSPKRNRNQLAVFMFSSGTLVLTEAGTKRRASISIVRGDAGLEEHDRGGLEVMTASLGEFAERLKSENHTLKRSLTDPRLFSGIGNAYSDEILHKARMSPLTLTSRLTDEGIKQLYDATRASLAEWTERLRKQTGDAFPEKVTAFRDDMAVHGKFKQPCPVCGTPIQRIRYADNETNYCARCQTGGKLLADRGMSRLLKGDWPKSIDEL